MTNIEMIPQIIEVIKNSIPSKFHYEVTEGKNFFGGKYVKIILAVSNYEINRVKGQYVQDVSLFLNDDLELIVQCYGGNGGQSIYTIPDKNNPKEKYLAMVSVKVPFRKPQKNETAVLNAIKKFTDNWVKILKENKSKLMYQDLINYNDLFE